MNSALALAARRPRPLFGYAYNDGHTELRMLTLAGATPPAPAAAPAPSDAAATLSVWDTVTADFMSLLTGTLTGACVGAYLGFTAAEPVILLPALIGLGGYALGTNYLWMQDPTTAGLGGLMFAGGGAAATIGLARLLFGIGPFAGGAAVVMTGLGAIGFILLAGAFGALAAPSPTSTPASGG